MEYKAPLESYTGKVREVILGKGGTAATVGGESIMPLHFFEGKTDNRPQVALAVWDTVLEEWAAGAVKPFKDVLSDPVKWAQKCLSQGADLICLKLVSTDPAGKNAPADQAAATVKRVLDAIGRPLIVYGSGDEQKDILVLTKVAEACSGAGLLIGPVVKENYEPIGKAALQHGHNIIAQSPLDINLEKELNVKLAKFFPMERVVIDPLSSALGYGMEYSFTIMERTKQAGVAFKDATMQVPMIADIGNDCWKTKQAKESEVQGILWESVTAVTLLLAGANILVLRHPQSLAFIKDIVEGKF
ncbi:MAG: acetyl-CoA decarbonylase/synthase complex subunit delta [Chloroflexota bacterium]